MQKNRVKYIDSPPILTLIISGLTIVLMFVNLNIIKSEALEYLIVIVSYCIIFSLPSFFYLKKTGFGLFKRIGFKFEKGKYIVPTILVSLITIAQSSIFKFGIFRLGYDYSAFSLYGSSLPIDGITFLEGILLVLAVVILPAVCEEFVFRGIIMNEYYECGPYLTILASSILFAFVHLDFSQFPIFLLNGLVLGLLAYISGSIIYPIIAHLIYNVFVLCFEKYLWLLSSDVDGEIFFWVFIVLIYLSLIFVGTIVFERLFKQRERRRKELGPETTQYAIKPVTYGNPWARIFLAAPMIGQASLFIVVAIIVAVL